jgi:hypothetical protein
MVFIKLGFFSGIELPAYQNSSRLMQKGTRPQKDPFLFCKKVKNGKMSPSKKPALRSYIVPPYVVQAIGSAEALNSILWAFAWRQKYELML